MSPGGHDQTRFVTYGNTFFIFSVERLVALVLSMEFKITIYFALSFAAFDPIVIARYGSNVVVLIAASDASSKSCDWSV